MKFSLQNKWVLITGGSSGFGAAAALAFAAEGACVVLGARRVDRLEKVAAKARQAGAPRAEFHILDVGSTASVTNFISWLTGLLQGQPLHVLINNAGGAHGVETIANGKDQDWEAMFQSNVLGILRMIRGAVSLLPKDAGATIINIGSVAGHTAYAGGAAYCAAKAGERQITRALRHELLGTGIRVSTVDPGLAETEFSLVRYKGDTHKAANVYADMNPLLDSDIADTLVWVASRPPHVDIDEIIIKPVDQAEVGHVHRRKPPAPK